MSPPLGSRDVTAQTAGRGESHRSPTALDELPARIATPLLCPCPPALTSTCVISAGSGGPSPWLTVVREHRRAGEVRGRDVHPGAAWARTLLRREHQLASVR